MKIALASLAAAAALFASAASAQETPHLLSESVNLAVVDGSMIPSDCMYPETLSDTARFELACVTMPRYGASMVAAGYLGQLGQQGWQQGAFISGGMTAVRTDENNCERVLNIFPGPYPPAEENSQVAVIWFAMDRTPRCAEPAPQ